MYAVWVLSYAHRLLLRSKVMNKRIFSFALGNIWRWTASQNIGELVDYTKELDISGVEVTFASKEELYAFALSGDDKSWLRNLDYVSIHAPFRLISESDNNEELIGQLDMIADLYKEINARNIVIHPDELPFPEILENYRLHFSTENLPLLGSAGITDLRNVFDTYPEMKLCLDVSHAYLHSERETGYLVDAFSERISQVHFSGATEHADHLSLRQVTERFMSSIQPIKGLHVPIVIEEDIESKNLEEVREEIRCIKAIFE